MLQEYNMTDEMIKRKALTAITSIHISKSEMLWMTISWVKQYTVYWVLFYYFFLNVNYTFTLRQIVDVTVYVSHYISYRVYVTFLALHYVTVPFSYCWRYSVFVTMLTLQRMPECTPPKRRIDTYSYKVCFLSFYL